MGIGWLLLTFWLGAAAGFGVFAMLQVSREEDKSASKPPRNFRLDGGC
jgi:hypothetical protein